MRNLIFRPGRAKYTLMGRKAYAATLSRFGQVRYSKYMLKCRTASLAQAYAERWAERVNRMTIGGAG